MKTMWNYIVLAFLSVLMLTGVAQAQVTLPEPLGEGVTIGDYVTAAITGLGVIMAVVIGGYFAFKLIQIGMKKVGWIGR